MSLREYCRHIRHQTYISGGHPHCQPGFSAAMREGQSTASCLTRPKSRADMDRMETVDGVEVDESNDITVGAPS